MAFSVTNLLRPFAVGLALAYLATSFFDVPKPLSFASKGTVAVGHTALLEPEKQIVLNKNILKLGNPLSVGLMPKDEYGGSGSWSITGTVIPLDDE